MDKTKVDFEHLDYLMEGNDRQKMAYRVLTHHNIFKKLEHFDPVLAGTIPIQVDIEESDLDIICCFADPEDFCTKIMAAFGHQKNFKLNELPYTIKPAVVANFELENFAIEIFGQNVPTKQQFAYRHLMVEHRLLQKHGEAFRQQIIRLKKQGYKTEPAFAVALGLSGDPYLALLAFEQ